MPTKTYYNPRTNTYSPAGDKSRRGFGYKLAGFIAGIGRMLVNSVSFFVSGRGQVFLGLLLFLVGLIISTDALWQSWYLNRPALISFGQPQGTKVYPWWQVGWMLISFPSGGFWSIWIAIALTVAIQTVQGITIRKRSMDRVKGEYEYYKKYSVGEEPGEDKLQMAKVKHREYKNNGVWSYRILILGALGTWVIDGVTTFSTHNPFSYWGDPGMVAIVFGWNLIRMFAAEFGFLMMTHLSENAQDGDPHSTGS